MKEEKMKTLKLVVASNNDHKIKEYKEMFNPLGIKIIAPKEINIHVDPEETGCTYEENSLIKAKAIAEFTSLPIIADDSGLSVRALNGFPGIHSSRYAKELGGNKTANVELIKKLQPYEDKGASFICVITLINVEEKPVQFKGICEGYILDKPQGIAGFGYDPIFYSIEANICFGLASEDIKNKYSHRAKALEKLVDYLKEKNLID